VAVSATCAPTQPQLSPLLPLPPRWWRSTFFSETGSVIVFLVVLLGLFGLGANPVLITMAIRFANRAPTLASALCTSSFNFGTAVGSWVAGYALQSTLRDPGPAMVGTVASVLTLILVIVIAVLPRSRPTYPDVARKATEADAVNVIGCPIKENGDAARRKVELGQGLRGSDKASQDGRQAA
jgi:MFS family permease